VTILAIIVALVLGFLAYRFVTGMIKFGIIALVAIVLIWFFANGVAH
jgi:hypothetical protein